MKAVIQRVKNASVSVEGEVISRINHGILTLLGVEQGDDAVKVEKMIRKILDLRIFDDAQGKMNRSIIDVKGAHLIVSQFTLLGDCMQGRRPSFFRAERPELARPLYEKALELSRSFGVPTQGGVFQAMMHIQLVNEGPTTFVLDF